MKKLLFWIRKGIRRDRNCSGCCVTCEYFKICSEDIEYKEEDNSL